MSLKQVLEESSESDEIFYVRMYQVALRGFYKMYANKFNYSEYQQRLEKENIEEAMFVGYIIRKGKVIEVKHKDEFNIDSKSGSVKIFRGKYKE